MGSAFRDAVLHLIKFPLFRRFLGGFARKRYEVNIHPSAEVARNVKIPRNLEIGARSQVLTSATLAPHVKLEADSVLAGKAPRGAELAGNPAQVKLFRTIGARSLQAPPLAQEALYALVQHFDFDNVLDIGCGEGWHASRLLEHGKQVTCVDLGDSCYFQKNVATEGVELIIGDYLATEFEKGKTFDCIWLSHVLEHQLDVQRFLDKIHADLSEGGVLALTVPPLKNEIVGGHVNLFNMGLLLYRLILAGFDCSQAHCKAYGYNLSIILRKKSIEVPALEYDSGDVEKLAEFFPFGAIEGFSGEIEQVNWPWPPREYFDDQDSS